MKLWFCILFPLLMLHLNQRVVSGKVVNSVSKKPVKDAFVVIVEGEEEAITNRDGFFVIRTSQQYPITLTIRHKQFNEKKISLNGADAGEILLDER